MRLEVDFEGKVVGNDNLKSLTDVLDRDNKLYMVDIKEHGACDPEYTVIVFKSNIPDFTSLKKVVKAVPDPEKKPAQNKEVKPEPKVIKKPVEEKKPDHECKGCGTCSNTEQPHINSIYPEIKVIDLSGTNFDAAKDIADIVENIISTAFGR